MSKVKERMKEPSTFVSLGAIVSGLGMLFKANGVPEAGMAMAQSADQLATGDFFTPLALIIGGLLGAILPERK